MFLGSNLPYLFVRCHSFQSFFFELFPKHHCMSHSSVHGVAIKIIEFNFFLLKSTKKKIILQPWMSHWFFTKCKIQTKNGVIYYFKLYSIFTIHTNSLRTISLKCIIELKCIFSETLFEKNIIRFTHIHWNRVYNCARVLCWNVHKCLQVPQLKEEP